MKVELTSDELQYLADEVRDALASEGAVFKREEAVKLSLQIEKYLDSLTSIERKIYESTQTLRQSALEKMQAAQLEHKERRANGEEITKDIRKEIYSEYGKARKALADELKAKQYLDKLSVHFKVGYQLIHSIRHYITGEEILYHVAVEGGKNTSSMIYQVNEEHLLGRLELDVYRFSEALIIGEENILDFNMRYRATKKRGREEGSTIIQDKLLKTLPNNGSTLWSRGYRVYSTVKEWVKNNPKEGKGFGVNFGHFLEAYYAMGGNKSNHTPEDFSSLKFFEYMIGLQNSVEFYKGGDFENIQLKSNNATLTNIKTIRSVLKDIQTILKENATTYEKDLKELLTAEKIEAQIASTDISIPEDLLKAIESLNK